MHRIDLEQVKRDGQIDLAQFIWAKTIYNALPAQARQAVAYLTTFADRQLTGTILHSKEYANVFKTRQQVLSGTKLQDDAELHHAWTEDVRLWRSDTATTGSVSDSAIEVPTTIQTVETTQDVKDGWLSPIKQSD